MKTKYLLLTLVVFLIYPFYVNAATCSKEERTRINALVNNIKITYNHLNDNYFNVFIENIPEELYVVMPSGKEINKNNQNEANQLSYLGGNKLTFKIYSSTGNNCINEMNYIKTIYIPKYNIYSEKEICKDEQYKDFKYCNENYSGTITDEKFNLELKKYEKQLEEHNEVQLPEKENNNYNIYMLIGTIIGTLIISIILIIVIKAKRSRRKIKL